MPDNSEFTSLPNDIRNAEWLDFYAILGVAADADAAALRERINQLYTEASSNYDHRNLNRRAYYHSLAEGVLPHCRRILLDPALRARYDRENEKHRDGAPDAIDLDHFLRSLREINDTPLPGSGDGKSSALLGADSAAPSASTESASAEPGAPAYSPPAAYTPPAAAAAPAYTPPVAYAPPTATPQAHEAEPTPAAATPEATADALAAEPESGLPPPDLDPTAPPAPRYQRSRPLITAAGGIDPGADEAAAAEDDPQPAYHEPRATVMTVPLTGPLAPKLAPREPEREPDDFSDLIDDYPKSGRVLSDMSRLLLTAIVATMLTVVILQYSNKTAMPARGPLTIAYASELGSVMDHAKSDFEKSPDSAGAEVVLQPMDSREGMFHALGKRSMLPNVWIPSESIWSNRYNLVAKKFGRRNIDSHTPIALSPVVLMARRDRSALLLKQFSQRIIPSWDALRAAVQSGGANHFGMTDPEKSGAGVTPRYFMAREWCTRKHIPFDAGTFNNAALWQWMEGFESNVPAYAEMTDAMAKDLALGTSGRYWWALVFESDAIYWLSKEKPIEVFYLPQTSLGDHPFCQVPPQQDTGQVNPAAVRFERFLHSDPMQHALLANGFRPTGLDLTQDTPDNPFTSTNMRKHGVRATGFNVDERFKYDTIDALTQQWHQRYAK